MQHHKVGYQPSRLRGYRLVVRVLFWVRVDDACLELLKLTSHFILLPGGERDGELLAAPLVGLEGPTSPFPYVSHNRTVVSVVDWR
jgi:hypothetical protein